MKSFSKLPLYLGLSVLVFSVLLSAIKVGEKTSVTNQKSKASFSGASLKMQFVPPDLISVIVNSEKEIAGADIAIKFEKNKVKILPTSLKAGPQFVTAGGEINQDTSVYSFSAIAKENGLRTGIIGTFKVKPNKDNEGNSQTTADFSFNLDGVSSAVIEKTSGKNILDAKNTERVYRYTITNPSASPN